MAAGFLRLFVESNGHAIPPERLPDYAPELNLVEYIWASLKQHAPANFCARYLDHLSGAVRRKLKSM